MKLNLKKTLLFFSTAGIVGGAAYFAFSNSSQLPKEMKNSEENKVRPEWFKKLKNKNPENLSDGMKTAQEWAKAGDERIAENWIGLICKLEKSNKPEEEEFCKEALKFSH